jgi:hypothetical protein
MAEVLLTVQIVNWNAREPLRAALRSASVASPRFPYEIVVLDNASSDGSVQMLEKEFPEVRLLVSEQNLGFSRGHQSGSARRTGQVPVHPEPRHGGHPARAGVAGGLRRATSRSRDNRSKILNPDGSLQYSCRRFPNPTAALSATRRWANCSPTTPTRATT